LISHNKEVLEFNKVEQLRDITNHHGRTDIAFLSETISTIICWIERLNIF
jgi:hypothetical protein